VRPSAALSLFALLLTLAAPLPLRAAAGASADDDLLRDHLWTQVRALPKGERPAVGLALSAGAVRGSAHIGVIQVLEEAGFPIDVVSGTSMGAIVGAVYAAGQPLDKLAGFSRALAAEATTLLSRARILSLMLTDSLISSKGIVSLLHEQIGDRRFDELTKPFACVAMDLRTGEKIVFRDGPLAPAVQASMGMPGIFKPVLYRHRYLVDGGVVDYVPVDLARSLGADWVLASVTENDYMRANPTSSLLALEQVIDIRGALLSNQQRREADAAIDVEFGDVGFLDFSRAEEMVERGVKAAKSQLPQAQESLILSTLPRLMERWGGRR
jgi:NTE family protein